MTAAIHPLKPHRPESTDPLVVARWTGRRSPTGPVCCDECGAEVEPGERCPACYQQAPTIRAGMLATVITTAGGQRRAVVAQRTPAGGWAPVRTVPATDDVIRALRRQDTTTTAVSFGLGADVRSLADWRRTRR
jgi:hypothetical protein